MAYNLVDDALAEVKVMANIPTSNGALTDAELLAIGNSELRGIMTGRLLEAMQGFMLAESTSALVSGQAAYDIPANAVGNKLAYVAIQRATGDRRALAAKSGAAMADFSRSTGSNGPPEAFYWLGTQLALYPTPSSAAESLVFGYYARPNRMVLTASCAAVTSAVSAGASSIPVSNAGAQLSTAGTPSVDVVSATPHFRTKATVTISAANTTTLTVNTGATPLTSALAFGDWACASGDSCVIQLPVELQPLLVARWALRVLKARAPSSPDTQALAQDVTDMEGNLFDFLSNRTESQPETLGPTRLLFGGAPYSYRSVY